MADELALSQTTDALGRVIHFRKLSLMERLNVNALLPPDWVGRTYNTVVAFSAAAVRKIDDVPVLVAKTTEVLMDTIERLGDEGYDATRDALDKQARDDDASAKERAKNSAGTPA